MKIEKRKIKLKSKNAKGFTMIEAVFGIFIVGIISVSFFVVMSKMLKVQNSTRDQIIATNLAQEGIELARNLRDNNWKSGLSDGFASFPFSGSNCTTACNPGTILGMPNAKFSRTIRVDNNADGSRTVTSTVTYGGKNIAIVDTLYAWANK
jgi:type II secretory pathway pseudopilin PulG